MSWQSCVGARLRPPRRSANRLCDSFRNSARPSVQGARVETIDWRRRSSNRPCRYDPRVLIDNGRAVEYDDIARMTARMPNPYRGAGNGRYKPDDRWNRMAASVPPARRLFAAGAGRQHHAFRSHAAAVRSAGWSGDSSDCVEAARLIDIATATSFTTPCRAASSSGPRTGFCSTRPSFGATCG